MTDFQLLAGYLANIFNSYTKKTDTATDIDGLKKVLEDVFPEKSTEIQTAFETHFPTLYPIV